MRGEPAGCGFDSEVLLVMAHHLGEHFGRKLEIGGIEVASDRGGKFGDEGQGFERSASILASSPEASVSILWRRSWEERMTKFFLSSLS